MNKLELKLNEFDQILKNHNRINYEELYQPLSNFVLDSVLKTIKVNNVNFETLYKWKNGFDFNKDVNLSCEIFEMGTLMSLNLVQDEIQRNQNDSFWRQTLIPIIADGTGQYLLFDNRKGPDFEKIFFYSPSITVAAIKPISCYDSIESLIDTTISAYKSGIISYDKDEEWLNVDLDRYFPLARKMNQNCDFWK